MHAHVHNTLVPVSARGCGKFPWHQAFEILQTRLMQSLQMCSMDEGQWRYTRGSLPLNMFVPSDAHSQPPAANLCCIINVHAESPKSRFSGTPKSSGVRLVIKIEDPNDS